jgi:DNA-binding response OmpR family regulator
LSGGKTGELPLAGSKPRAVLAILLLHANEVVSSERLIDALWGDEPPPRKGEPFDLSASAARSSTPSTE